MAVQVGLKDLHYALLTADTSAAVTYDSPVKIAGAISARISPAVNTATLYADDGPDEVTSSLGEITVELQAKDIPLSVQAALLGHTIGADKVMVKKANDTAPYVAIGFKSLKSNGKYRYIWLYKGKFQLQEQEYRTKEDTPEFQVPTLVGTFVKRIKDNKWQSIGDEDATGFTQASTWFKAVV